MYPNNPYQPDQQYQPSEPPAQQPVSPATPFTPPTTSTPPLVPPSHQVTSPVAPPHHHRLRITTIVILSVLTLGAVVAIIFAVIRSSTPESDVIPDVVPANYLTVLASRRLPISGDNFKLTSGDCLITNYWTDTCILIDANSPSAIDDALDTFVDTIDPDISDFFFGYANLDNPFVKYPELLSEVPTPTHFFDDYPDYAAAIFTYDSKYIYRALYLKIGANWILMNTPAPVLNSGSYIGTPREVISTVNAIPFNKQG